MAESDEIVKERRLQILEMSLGRDIMRYMHDDNVTEVIVNPDGKLWLDTFDKGFLYTGITIDEDEAKRVIYSVAASRHPRIPALFQLPLPGGVAEYSRSA